MHCPEVNQCGWWDIKIQWATLLAWALHSPNRPSATWLVLGRSFTADLSIVKAPNMPSATKQGDPQLSPITNQLVRCFSLDTDVFTEVYAFYLHLQACSYWWKHEMLLPPKYHVSCYTSLIVGQETVGQWPLPENYCMHICFEWCKKAFNYTIQNMPRFCENTFSNSSNKQIQIQFFLTICYIYSLLGKGVFIENVCMFCIA